MDLRMGMDPPPGGAVGATVPSLGPVPGTVNAPKSPGPKRIARRAP